MKMLNTQPKEITCSNNDSPFMYFAWPSVTRLQDGTLAMVTSGLRLEHICPFGKGVISYSKDEGKTWTRPAVVIDTPLDDRDSGIVPFGKNRVIFTSFNNTTGFQRMINDRRRTSTDSVVRAKADLIDAYLNYVEAMGDSEKYVGSTYCMSDDGGYTFGKVKTCPVTSPHGPCCLNDGTLLWVGRRFSKINKFDDGKIPFIQVYKLGENDEFEYVTDIENVSDEDGLLYSCEPHTIQLPSGKIIVHIRVQRYDADKQRTFTIYQSESLDGGKTFSKPRRLLGALGGSPAHLLRHSSGKLISVYGYREDPHGIRAMISDDDGETWDTDWILDAQGANEDLGYPASVELKDGSILTLYYENVGGVSCIKQNIWRL